MTMKVKKTAEALRAIKKTSPILRDKISQTYSLNKRKDTPSLRSKSMKPKLSAAEPLRKPRDPKGTGPIRPTFRKKLDALKRRKPMSS